MPSTHSAIQNRIMGSELEFGFSVTDKNYYNMIPTFIIERANKLLIPREFYNRPCLLNQARFAVDGRVPEYKTPECLGPRELSLHEAAAVELIGSATNAIKAAERMTDKTFSLHKSDRNCEVKEIKNDSKDFYCPTNSFGSCHSNYLTYRRIEFNDIKNFLTPFLLTRWICIGNGWFEIGPKNKLRFLLSQRAGLIGKPNNNTSSGDTRVKPLISTKDESLADEKIWRRYHDVSGNQNMSQWQIYLKHAAMDLMFMMIETPNFLTLLPPIVDKRFKEYEHLNPSFENSQFYLTAITDFFNADIFGEKTVRLANGVWWSALDFQRYFISEVERYKRENRGPFSDEREAGLQFWIKITDAIERKDLAFLARYLDWAAILYYFVTPALNRLGEELDSVLDVNKKGVTYNRKIETKNGEVKILSYIHNLIIEYANIATEKSPYGLLTKKGLIEQMFLPEEIFEAQHTPPKKTRAACREELMLWVKERPNMIVYNEQWIIIVLEENGKKFNVLFKDPYCRHEEKTDGVYSHFNPQELLNTGIPCQ